MIMNGEDLEGGGRELFNAQALGGIPFTF